MSLWTAVCSAWAMAPGSLTVAAILPTSGNFSSSCWMTLGSFTPLLASPKACACPMSGWSL